MTPAAPGRDGGQETIHLVAYCNLSFVDHMATMIRSAVENLSPRFRIRAYVLHCEVGAGARARAEASWPPGAVDVAWRHLSAASLAFKPHQHISAESFLRLLVGTHVDPDAHRAIILDSDLIVRGDLSELWTMPMGANVVLAAQDQAAPYAGLTGSPLLREKGLAPSTPCFNAGVLVVDLERWRRESVEAALLEVHAREGHLTLWGDQCILNAVLRGRWGRLPPFWNAQGAFDAYADWRDSPFSAADFRRTRSCPAIAHFTGRDKPWHAASHHWQKSVYYEYRARTAVPLPLPAPSPRGEEIRRVSAAYVHILWLIVQRRLVARAAGIAHLPGLGRLGVRYLRMWREAPLAAALTPLMGLKFVLRGFLHPVPRLDWARLTKRRPA